MKIVILHHQYGEKYEKKSIRLIKKLIEMLTYDYEILITDNFSEGEIILEEKVKKVHCSNENREFSGWDIAMSSIEKSKYDIMIFSNDTIIKNRNINKSILKSFSRGIEYINTRSDACMLGDVDTIRSEPPYFNNNYNEKYISTYLFAVNRAGIGNIKNISYSNQINKLFNYKKNNISVLNDEYKNSLYLKFIEYWLYLPHNGYKWYQHQKLNLDNYDSMMAKFKCIVNENYLSQNFIENNGFLIDFKNFKKSILNIFE